MLQTAFRRRLFAGAGKAARHVPWRWDHSLRVSVCCFLESPRSWPSIHAKACAAGHKEALGVGVLRAPGATQDGSSIPWLVISGSGAWWSHEIREDGGSHGGEGDGDRKGQRPQGARVVTCPLWDLGLRL